MLDNGRKYFTPDWIHARIRQLAYLKYNVLHLHFSDNEGFRIESSVHPEVVTAEHLTKREVAEIVALAARYHITVVPEIDSPGHLGAALRAHPELQIERAVGGRDPNNLDFTDDRARRFVRELIEEYLDLFPGPWWHIGGDEFVFTEAQWQNYPSVSAWAQAKYGPRANHYDAFFDYINWLDALLRSQGRMTRMWSGHLGGNIVRLRPSIVNEVWHRGNGVATPDDIAAAGNDVLNAMYWPTYYVVSPHWYARPDRPLMKDWYEDWRPWEFDGDVNQPAPDVLARVPLPQWVRPGAARALKHRPGRKAAVGRE
jgi:hexosaminidase